MILAKFFIIITYIFIGAVTGGAVTMLFQLLIEQIWEKSNKTKGGWLVERICLNGDNVYDKRHPKWFKLLQILVLLTWPFWLISISVILGVYYCLYRFPVWVYKKPLKGIYNWWIGDNKEK